MDQTRTGSLIRRLRLEQGMTQLALAERLGVSDKAVSKWDGAAVRQIADRLCHTGGKPTAIFTPCKGGGSHEIGSIRPNRRKTAFYHCQINRRQPASKHKTAPCARHDAVFIGCSLLHTHQLHGVSSAVSSGLCIPPEFCGNPQKNAAESIRP